MSARQVVLSGGSGLFSFFSKVSVRTPPGSCVFPEGVVPFCLGAPVRTPPRTLTREKMVADWLQWVNSRKFQRCNLSAFQPVCILKKVIAMSPEFEMRELHCPQNLNSSFSWTLLTYAFFQDLYFFSHLVRTPPRTLTLQP